MDRLSIVKALDAHECLDEQGLGVFQVEVHDAHHGETHINCAELLVREGMKLSTGKASGKRTSLDVSERS